ncbi:MAG: FtsQ-type POTRA domain-containing protein [Acidobacteria bacterium]|nr:FtsQ-type POTRA domain-containing protein [Acidobacteriota bacterium]
MAEKIKQVVVPRKRNSRTKKLEIPKIDWEKLRTYGRITMRISMAIGCLVAIVFLYNQVVSLPAFQLRDIQVRGNLRISSAEIEKAIKQNLSGTLMTTSLKSLQEQLNSFVWIKRAQVTRILPDTLRIRIEERKPLALVRFEGEQAPVWVDDEGVTLGEYDSTLDKELPPLVVGFNRESVKTDKQENFERIEMYKQLMNAFDGGPKKYSPLIEEIDISNLKDIRILLSEGSVEVDLGDRDFRARLMRALDVLNSLRHRDIAKLKGYKFLDPQILEQPEQIRFISVVHPTQIAIKPARAQNKTSSENLSAAQKER